MSDAPPRGKVRPETKTALWLLGAGLTVGLFHVLVRGGGFAAEAGRGGMTDLLGTSFVAAVLWAMLTIRALAADGSAKDALDDGLTATAAATWMVALAPPRLSNYLQEGATSDFAFAYLPASLVTVLLMNGAVALWPRRTQLMVALRLFATAAPGLVVLGLLLRVVGGGPDAGEAAIRASAAGAAAAVIAAAVHLVARRSSAGDGGS
ncbi:MAG: hypothetical protein AB1938_28210 [Myxococcota bacterium]